MSGGDDFPAQTTRGLTDVAVDISVVCVLLMVSLLSVVFSIAEGSFFGVIGGTIIFVVAVAVAFVGINS
jgi:hypothetical protein